MANQNGNLSNVAVQESEYYRQANLETLAPEATQLESESNSPLGSEVEALTVSPPNETSNQLTAEQVHNSVLEEIKGELLGPAADSKETSSEPNLDPETAIDSSPIQSFEGAADPNVEPDLKT